MKLSHRELNVIRKPHSPTSHVSERNDLLIQEETSPCFIRIGEISNSLFKEELRELIHKEEGEFAIREPE
jgi:hypothetical protein